MKKIFMISLVFSIALAGCAQPTIETLQQSSIPSSPPSTAAQAKDSTDNTLMSDMLSGKLNDKIVEVTGTVLISETNDIGGQTLTTIQIYPDPNNEKQIIAAYFTSPLSTAISIDDTVKIKGVCKGPLDLNGMDINAVKLLGQSVEKI